MKTMYLECARGCTRKGGSAAATLSHMEQASEGGREKKIYDSASLNLLLSRSWQTSKKGITPEDADLLLYRI